MKWIFYCVLIILFPAQVFADTSSMVITGNAQSSSTVTTNIQGSGDVSTHIESTVNGNTKILDSNKPGTYTLNNSSDDISSEPTVSLSPTTIPATSTSTTTPSVIKIHSAHYEIPVLQEIRNFFHTTIQKLLKILRL